MILRSIFKPVLQSAQILACQCRGGDDQRRLRDHLSFKAIAALVPRAAATGWSPVYPCHVSPREMRKHPIGTGPFKFVDFKPNQSITVVRNPDYWKPGRPYLDGICPPQSDRQPRRVAL
jgi:ABC-type transport system substrate-binding protein